MNCNVNLLFNVIIFIRHGLFWKRKNVNFVPKKLMHIFLLNKFITNLEKTKLERNTYHYDNSIRIILG